MKVSNELTVLAKYFGAKNVVICQYIGGTYMFATQMRVATACFEC